MEEPLVDLEMSRRVAEDCGWSVPELGRFYLDGLRKQIGKLRAAIEANDEAEVLRLAHGSAGSSELSGVSGIGTLFRSIEAAETEPPLEVALQVLATVEGRLEEVERIFSSA